MAAPSAGPCPENAGASSSLPSAGADMMSRGRLTNAAPGRPASAARNALLTTSATACGAPTEALNLVTGLQIDTESMV
jgi:hypothetical protein